MISVREKSNQILIENNAVKYQLMEVLLPEASIFSYMFLLIELYSKLRMGLTISLIIYVSGFGPIHFNEI